MGQFCLSLQTGNEFPADLAMKFTRENGVKYWLTHVVYPIEMLWHELKQFFATTINPCIIQETQQRCVSTVSFIFFNWENKGQVRKLSLCESFFSIHFFCTVCKMISLVFYFITSICHKKITCNMHAHLHIQLLANLHSIWTYVNLFPEFLHLNFLYTS